MNAIDTDDFFLDIEGCTSGVLAGDAFRAWRLRKLLPREFHALGAGVSGQVTPLQVAYLAHFNLLAPTTHNSVPQRYEIGEGKLSLWLDRSAVLPESDPNGRQAEISMGCGLANLALAARCMGLHAEIAITPEVRSPRPRRADEPRYVRFAEVAFTACSVEPLSSEWLDAMLNRKVLRAEYDDGVRLPSALGAEFERIVSCHAGLRLHLLSDPATLLFFGKFQELADSAVLNREGFARELGNWFHPNDSTARLGMRGREYGLTDAAALHFHRSLRGEERLLPDEGAGFARASNRAMRSSSAVAVITAATDDLPSRVAAGQAYQYMALESTRQGFYTAMHAGITEVEVPNLALRGRLRTMQRPIVVFRVGKPLHVEDASWPHAARPWLNDLLLPSV